MEGSHPLCYNIEIIERKRRLNGTKTSTQKIVVKREKNNTKDVQGSIIEYKALLLMVDETTREVHG
jgi:hypothetical protein